jgi:hypothetical protein
MSANNRVSVRGLVSTALLALVCGASSLEAQVTAIRAGRLIDPVTATAARDQVIVVEAGRIKAVGPGFGSPAGPR